LHDRGIVYRDLKPENVILDPDGHIRLADFGLAKFMDEDELTHSFCGSAEYMAPEMLTKSGHNFAIDFYCLGALLYELVTGLPPYYSSNYDILYKNILNCPVEFP
jgi:serine/threonine protein kinase